jgi:hypothetical protein
MSSASVPVTRSDGLGSVPIGPALPERVLADVVRMRERMAPLRPGGPAALRTEIELAPAELGRLRIALHASEAGLQVAITADRPETLDLVRRQLEGFQRGLASEGVTLDRLELSGGGAGERDRDAPSPRQGAAATDGAAEPPASSELAGPPETRPAARPSAGRLDLRC